MPVGRMICALALAAVLSAGSLLATAGPAAQRRREVKVGLIAPMSGPWARQGDLMLKGANLAIDDINKAGGIKALGGAKLKLWCSMPATASRRRRTPRSA